MKLTSSYNDWLCEQYASSVSDQYIVEGGASGHMNHPFDDMSLTFGDFKRMIISGLSGRLNFEEVPSEKTDGQNLWATVNNGEVLFARNKTETIKPMSLQEFKQKFKDHPVENVRLTFSLAADDLSELLIKLSKKDQDDFFDKGRSFIVMELIYSKNPNVINYDIDVIQFHNITQTDGSGNVIGTDTKKAKTISAILDKVNANIGKTFSVIPPRELILRKSTDFSTDVLKFLGKLKTIQNEFNCSDTDTLLNYNEKKWAQIIDSKFPSLDVYNRDILIKRWAWNDKKQGDIRLLNITDKDQLDEIKKLDKEDSKKIYKKHIEPFEDLFLELGSVIIKNASNFVAANPEKEAIRLREYLNSVILDIKKSGTEDQIIKVQNELDRLNRIGGIDSIYPTEGIVYVYNNKTYKLTGTFAALNQLVGIIKYGR